MALHYAQGKHAAVICGQEFIETDYGVQLALRILPDNGEYERTVFLGLTDEKGRPASFVNGNGDTVNVADQSLEIIKYLGLPDGRLSTLDPNHPEHCSFNGVRVDCYCQHKRKDDGSEVERWYINTPRALPGKPVEKAQLKKLDSLFGRALKDKEKGLPPVEPVTPSADLATQANQALEELRAEGTPEGDEDVPW